MIYTKMWCPVHKKYDGEKQPKRECQPCWDIFCIKEAGYLISGDLHLEVRVARKKKRKV